MPDNPEGQEVVSQNEGDKPKQKENLIKKTWNRVPAPARVITAATLTLAGLAGVVKGQEAISQNDEGKPNGNIAERTIEPTTEPTQVVEITSTPINETPTPSRTEASTPNPQETEAPQNAYESIRMTIENSQLSEDQKNQAEQQLDVLKGIESSRQQFIDYYYQRTDSSGQPLLLTLTKQKYAGIDQKTLEGFDPKNPDQAYENTLFFMHDKSEWENTTAPQLALLQSEQDAEVIVQKLAELAGLNSGQLFYLEADTKDGVNVTITTDFTPQTEEERHLLEQTIAHIGTLKDQLPLYGNIEFRINNSNINNHNYLAAEDKTVIDITLENPAISAPIPITHKAHEAIHALECADVTYIDQNGQNQTMENSVRCVRYLPPEKVVDAMIAREAFLANPTVGRKYPMRLSPSESFQIQVINSQITGEEASKLANDYATQRYEEWANNTPQQRIDRTDSEAVAQFGAVTQVFETKLQKDQNTQLFEDYLNIFRNN